MNMKPTFGIKAQFLRTISPAYPYGLNLENLTDCHKH